MEFHKARCLRWISPYFPGSDPASRERTALEQANHESNIKVVVLGDDPTPRQFATELLKGEVPWTVTTYDYVAGQWTLTGARELCTDPPGWNQESQSRIMIFAPRDALTEEVDDDLGEAGNGDGGDDFGHPMGDQKEDDHEEPGDGGELADDDNQNINDPPEAGNATEYPANEGSAMLGVELPVEGNNPQVQEKPKDKFPIKVLLALSNCPMM